METVYAPGTPLATYLEGKLLTASSIQYRTDSSTGDGYLEPTLDRPNPSPVDLVHQTASDDTTGSLLAPPRPSVRIRHIGPPPAIPPNPAPSTASWARGVHHAWSTAVNSRLGRADNARFIEHFRYVIVASQLLNEYIDQGSVLPSPVATHGLDGSADDALVHRMPPSVYGAAATATVASAFVYLLDWARSSRSGLLDTGRVTLVLAVFVAAAVCGYAYLRRQWLKSLRRRAVADITSLTETWQGFEVCASSGLSLIQEVELVSKGYRISTPLSPASRLEDSTTPRRCVRLRKSLYRTYGAVIPAAVEACRALRTLVDEDDLEKFFEIYDINEVDAKEAHEAGAPGVSEDDGESLQSLRMLSCKATILRRVAFCSLMALEADGGAPDFKRWRSANATMEPLSKTVAACAEKIQQCLRDMETISSPLPAAAAKFSSVPPARDKMRSQVRKLSMLSSGIRGLQAKMQLLREEAGRAIERSDDPTDLGPDLMAQYESIGADLKDLLSSWEAGKASLQTNLVQRERRLSAASAARYSPVASLSGLTAVDEAGEAGGPADALAALTGADPSPPSNRSSLATTAATDPEDDDQKQPHLFEAVAMPPSARAPRAALSREDRLMRMQEERDRQAAARARRDANTSMLRELESVINLRPKNGLGGGGGGRGAPRVTSI